jgi:hypothetical protein
MRHRDPRDDPPAKRRPSYGGPPMTARPRRAVARGELLAAIMGRC